MKTSVQLKALIRNLSSELNIGSEVLLRSFMMERLLERIANSEFRHSFILKGGMLIASMVGIGTRSTMDMDATIKGHSLSASEIMVIIERVLLTPIDDGAEFTLLGIEEIREDADYPGYRVSIAAKFDQSRQSLKVDITTGDFVTPKEIEYSFKLMFEDRKIEILAYNLETVLAEKFETVVTRGVTNTRMRDFYDIHILTATQPFAKEIFKEALQKTVAKRGTIEQMAGIHNTITMVSNSPSMIVHWERYCKKYSYASEVTWEMAIGAVKALAAMVESRGEVE
ncbi:MAG: nucleotidyl transferase AbiEii/AbiGii toxin family protein [Candidatus Cloacimonetes bacterium]|nr:nucleotidyl transferase AbiEii/AbiGii toxin family protein [Candidatus Cloacimonadota bacterium]